jgi:hypothetical protein
MPTLTSLHLLENEKFKHFSGQAVYTNAFEISKEQLQSSISAKLGLNKVEEIADVYLNGERLGNHWYQTQQFDVTGKLKEGTNILTVEVVNSINNGLIGDAKKPEEFRIFRSNISKLPNAWMKPFAEAPLLPAGLIGPVYLSFVLKE